MKKRPPSTAEGSILPADLAAGPDPAVWAVDHEPPPWITDAPGRRQARQWAASGAWRSAGESWSREQALGDNGWRTLLPPDVAYAVSALGRAHAMHGDYSPPWCRP